MKRLLLLALVASLCAPAAAVDAAKKKKPGAAKAAREAAEKKAAEEAAKQAAEEQRAAEEAERQRAAEAAEKEQARQADKKGAPAGADEGADGDAGDAPPGGGDAADVEALRKEYDRIRERLFTSRARAAAVGDALYSTRLTVHLKYATGRFYGVTRATIRLDGANVFDDTAGAISDDDAPRFSGFIAPGKHLLTIRIEAQSKDDDRVVYTTEDTFSFDAPAEKDVLVKAKASDGGDIGWTWKRKAKGSYKLHLDVNLEARARAKDADAK